MNMNLDNINYIIKKFNLDINNIQVVQHQGAVFKNYYVLESVSNRKYFLKFQRTPKNIIRKIIRIIFGNPSFSRMIKVYELLGRRSFEYLKFPKLVRTNGKDIFIIDYVDFNNRGIDIKVYKSVIIKSIVEFQNVGRDQSELNGNINQKLLNIYLSFVYKYISRYGMNILKNYGLADYIKCIRIIILSHFKQRKLRHSILVHNDLHHNNIIIANNGDVYLTDFEGVSLENKWVLVDVATLAVRTHEYLIDTDLILLFLNELMKNKNNKKIINIKVQVRIAILRRIVQLINSSVSPPEVISKYYSFFSEVLTSDKLYDEWYDTKIGTKLERDKNEISNSS